MPRPIDLVKRQDPARPHGSCEPPQHQYGISQELQHVAAHDRVELGLEAELDGIAHLERHGAGRADAPLACNGDRRGSTVDPEHKSTLANKFGSEEGNVATSSADV